jgi:UDP:flavonoid glycosyltransferase YjiC (YdhE family)
VRILFAFVGGSGHAEPLLPVARAAVRARHTVAVTGRPGVVETLGLPAFPTGSAVTTKRIPLRAVDRRREDDVLRDGFADRHARARAAAVLDLCRAWRPDVVVCDEIDFGSMIAAERLGIPHATVLVTAAGSFVRREVVGEALDAVRADHGLEPDPGLAMPSRHLVLSPFPPGFRDPAFPLPPTAHGFRALEAAARVDGPATVYFTLGTVFPLESGDLFARVLAGLAELPVEVVATTGPELDPAELGPQPPNVRLERHLPHADVLPRCSAVVTHGGSGTVLGALAHGLPLVVVPLGADQPQNADRCEALGLGVVLDPVEAIPEDVRGAAAVVLSEPSYRAAAERMRDELAAFPSPEHAVALLERL